MSFKVAHTFLACGVLLAACTMGTNSPATAPSTISSVASTSTMATTSTLLPDPTTTTVDRLTEIAAIFEDLERRRLQGIFDQDEEAFRAVFANEAYEEESMVVFHTIAVIDPSATFEQVVLQVFHDGSTCLAAQIQRDHSAVLADGGRSTWTYVVEQIEGDWGVSWIGLEWECSGPHPLS